MTMIIPARALNELARIAQDGDSSVTLISPPGRGQVVFHLETAELVSQLIDGNFPDYKVIMPRAFKTHTIVSTQALLKACKQAEIIARNGNNVVRLTMQKFEDRPGEIEVTAQSEETGENESKIDANIEGPGAGGGVQRALPARGARGDQDAQPGPGNQRSEIARARPAGGG